MHKSNDRALKIGFRPREYGGWNTILLAFKQIFDSRLRIKVMARWIFSTPEAIQWTLETCSLLVKELDSDAEDPGSSPGCSPDKFFPFSDRLALLNRY